MDKLLSSGMLASGTLVITFAVLTVAKIDQVVGAQPTIEISQPKVVPKDQIETTFMYYRDDKLEEYREMMDKIGPNVKMENSVLCQSILGMVVRTNDNLELSRLIELGVDVTICTNNPVRVAIIHSRLAPLELLLNAGAPVDGKDEYGVRPLETAIAEFPLYSNYNPATQGRNKGMVGSSFGIIELLIKQGADLSQETNKGLSYSQLIEQEFSNISRLHEDYAFFKQRLLEMVKVN